MLTNKAVYKFLFSNRVLNRLIAKDTVGFNYLNKVNKKLCNFGNLISFRDNITGLHLLYSEYEKSQFLKNGKLAFKSPYVYYMHLNNLECFDESFLGYSSRYQVVRATGNRLQLRRLRHIFEQFEEVHNGIVLNIYTPSNNHYPVQVHSNKVYIMLKKRDTRLRKAVEKKLFVGVYLELTVVNFHYYFRLHLAEVISSVSAAGVSLPCFQ